MSELRPEDCLPAGCCGGELSQNEARVIYEATRGMRWRQPTVLSDVLARRSPYGDPAIANVNLHTVACTFAPVPGTVYDVPASLNGEAAEPPRANLDGDTPPDLLNFSLCSQLTVGRGSGPQFRVRFKDGSEDGVTLWVDGSSCLAWPADTVTVDVLTPLLLAPLNTGLRGQGLPHQITFAALTPQYITDAMVYASVSWSSRNATPSAPGGMATFTQTEYTVVPPEGGAPFPIYFERPPFARRVQLQYSAALFDAAGPLAVADFTHASLGLGLAANGLTVGGNGTAEFNDVPGPATHVRVSPLAGAPEGGIIQAIWEIGVR